MSDADRVLTIENIQSFSVEDFLELLKEKQKLSVQLSDRLLILEVRQEELKPLPVLEAHVPSGWKQAIYQD